MFMTEAAIKGWAESERWARVTLPICNITAKNVCRMNVPVGTEEKESVHV